MYGKKIKLVKHRYINIDLKNKYKKYSKYFKTIV